MNQQVPAVSLKDPPEPFAPLGLQILTVDAAQLVRVGRRNTGEPFFSGSLDCRFNDSSLPESARYKACYTAKSLLGAVGESILHNEEPVEGEFRIAPKEVQSRFVISFEPSELKIADLTGVHLKKLGANAALSSILPYEVPQKWARAVYDHRDQVDGFQYISRHVNTEIAVVLFDRAKPKIKVKAYTPALSAPDMKAVLDAFNVKFI